MRYRLSFCLIPPVPLHDPQTHRHITQCRVHEIYDEEGLACLGNIRAVLSFQLLLRLVGTEMHRTLTDPAHARIDFKIHSFMCRCRAGVQCGN